MEFSLRKLPQSKIEAELRDSFTPEAEKQAKTYLILKAIASQENISFTPEEIEERISTILKHFPNIETAQKQLDLERLKAYTEGVIRQEKTLQLLESFTKQEVSDTQT